MTLEPHSIAWYARLAGQQKGYFYPWHSQLAPHNGEDSFWPLVFEHLHPELDVLEIACAQGDLALAMAPGCRSVLAYDVTQEGTQCHSSLLGRQVHGDRDEYG